MSSLNKIILIGEVVSTPDIKATNSGDSVANLVLSVQRPSRVENSNPGADKVKVVAWRDKADLLRTVSQGSMLLVEGRIHTRSYDNNEGQRVYVTEVEAREIRPLGEQGPSLEGFQLPKQISEEAPVKKAPRKKPVLEEKDTRNDAPDFDFRDDEKSLAFQSSNPSSQFGQFESDDIPF